MSELTSSNWSETAASNNAAPPNGWPEGMNPSDVNNAAREMMAAVKRWFNRATPVLTAGGGTTNYTLTPAVALSAYALEIWSWKMPSTNAADATMNISTLGARNIRKLTATGYANVAAGDLPSGAYVQALYNTSDNKFDILSISTGANASTYARAIGQQSIWGLTYANNAGDATNDIDIAAGGCMDATGAYQITLAALTKRSDAAWAVGTNQGGLDDIGSAGNNDFYIWAIARSDTGVTDILFSLSATAPTLPGSYDYKRRVGWFKRAGGAIVAFHTYEMAGGGLEFAWDSPTLDIDLTSTLTTTRRTDAVKVPLDFSVFAILNVLIADVTTSANAYVYCPDRTDVAPSQTAAPLATIHSVTIKSGVQQVRVRTSAAGLIAARADLATVDSYRVATLGFEWSRR